MPSPPVDDASMEGKTKDDGMDPNSPSERNGVHLLALMASALVLSAVAL